MIRKNFSYFNEFSCVSVPLTEVPFHSVIIVRPSKYDILKTFHSYLPDVALLQLFKDFHGHLSTPFDVLIVSPFPEGLELESEF